MTPGELEPGHLLRFLFNTKILWVQRLLWLDCRTLPAVLWAPAELQEQLKWLRKGRAEVIKWWDNEASTANSSGMLLVPNGEFISETPSITQMIFVPNLKNAVCNHWNPSGLSGFWRLWRWIFSFTGATAINSHDFWLVCCPCLNVLEVKVISAFPNFCQEYSSECFTCNCCCVASVHTEPARQRLLCQK